MRAFLTKAQWNIPSNPVKSLIYCDNDGRLSITAVAASANGLFGIQTAVAA